MRFATQQLIAIASIVIWLVVSLPSSRFSRAAAPIAKRSQTLRYFIEAEHTTLQGASQAGGSAVWCYGGSATWDTITAQGSYRLFLRVRAGFAGDHKMAVNGKTSYRVTVDGRKASLRIVPKTLVYSSDESNWAWIVADLGKLKRGAHSLVFKSAWQFGRWDAFLLTTDKEFTPAKDPKNRKETPLDLSLLDAKQRKWFQGYTIWNAPIEKNCPPSEKPASARSIASISVTACKNEHTATVLNVTNWLDKPLLFRVSRGDIEEASKPTVLPSSAITLRRAIPLPAPRKHRLADALPKLDEAGLLLVPARETRQLWVELNTRSLKPGKFTAKVSVEPLITAKRCAKQEVVLKLQVVNLTLPRQHPLGVFLFDYDTKRPGMDADLGKHYVNWRHNCLIPHPATANPDFLSMHRSVKREMAAGARHIYFEHWHFRTDSSWRKTENRKKWIAGIRKWAKYVRHKLGIPYTNFSLHIYDEVSGKGIDTFLRAREIVRLADPKVRVTMTLTPQITEKEVRRLNSGVDLWSPHMELYENKSKVLGVLKATGKPIFPYYCAENKRFWPAQHYRLWSWKAYRQRVDGLFMWTYLSRNAWQGRSWDGGMVFAGNGNMIPSRRWELMRLGLQDWLLLDRAARSGHRKLVDQLVSGVLKDPDNPALLRQSRQKLLTLLRK